jgi:hypothetical protein
VANTVITVEIKLVEVEKKWGNRLAQLCKAACEKAILEKELDIYEASGKASVEYD